jgi:hypothetical protein
MNVLEPKQKGELSDEVKDLLKILKFGSKSVELKGSSSLKSQRYFSDYDFFVSLKKPSAKVAHQRLFTILKNIWEDERLYFIELKLQTKEGKKIRYFPEDKPDFTEEELAEVWPDIDFVKIDLVAYFDYRFIDVSVIYSFTDTKPTKEEYVEGLRADIKELKKEGRYFKVLKRLFNIYKVEGNEEKLLMLSKFFNSDAGLFYRKISNNEAINSVSEHYLDDTTARRIDINKKQLGDVGDDDEARINRQAKKLYTSLSKD